MIKKLIFSALAVLSIPAVLAFAATPILNISGTGTSNATVSITGGELNAPAVLYYYSPSRGIYQAHTLGSTDANGAFTGSVDTNILNTLGANLSMPVYVQVGGYQSAHTMWPGMANATGTIMFSNASPTLGQGGTGSVTLSGGTGSYYILNNSNMGNVSASISGNTLNLYGAANGQSTITVCSTSGGCGTFTATVQSPGAPTLSLSNLNVAQGGQGSITLSGGAGPYTVSIPVGSGISTTLLGNTLYVNVGSNTTGSNTITVCSSNGSCTPLTVNAMTQSNTGTGNTGTTGGLSLSLPLTVGQNLQVGLSGNGSGSFFLQTPMSSPALASVSGNTLMLNGATVGNGTVTVCQTGGSCLPIRLSVSQGLTGTGGGHLFDTDLSIGMRNDDVLALQQRLSEEGYFTVTPTGYFGPITASAVMRYQAAHGIATTGYVGPLTRAMLNR
jgi:hypothetical protein